VRRGQTWEGLDAARRVGFAKYYAEMEHARQLEIANEIYRDRVETLLPEFLRLVNAVLYERNAVAFKYAYRVKTLIDQFQCGSRSR
jgi:hypothetical protein